jgi:hypothetical protein
VVQLRFQCTIPFSRNFVIKGVVLYRKLGLTPNRYTASKFEIFLQSGGFVKRALVDELLNVKGLELSGVCLNHVTSALCDDIKTKPKDKSIVILAGKLLANQGTSLSKENLHQLKESMESNQTLLKRGLLVSLKKLL